MYKRYYRIVNQLVLIEQDWEEAIHMLRNFEDTEGGTPDFTAELYQDRRRFNLCYGIEYYRQDPSCNFVFLSKSAPEVRMTTERDWSHAVIEGCVGRIEGVMELLLTAFYSMLSQQRGILLHASLVSYEEKALIFVGDSGIGKTTQAELWARYKNAEILNGDKVILIGHDGAFQAWGSPWSGSSPYAVNKFAPLCAAVLLKQAEDNIIRRLDQSEVYSGFLRHIFYPSWDAGCTEEVMKTLDLFMRKIPVYELACLPDSGAVSAAYDEIWGKQEK